MAMIPTTYDKLWHARGSSLALTGFTSEKHEDVLVAAKKEVLRREE